MPPPQRFHSLDALRGVAALAVVCFHWPNMFYDGTAQRAGFSAGDLPLYRVLRIFYDSGHLAVDLFFGLSGFIFFWLYAERVARRDVSPGRFFMLRFSRLYPLHALTLLLVLAGQVLYLRERGDYFVWGHNDARHFAMHVAMASSVGLEQGLSFNAPVWSVSVEAVLYGLFFLVCAARLQRPWLLALLSLAGFFLLWRIYPPLGRGVGSFFLGGCLYFAYLRVVGSRWRKTATWTVAAVAAASWGAALWFTHSPLPEDAPSILQRVAWRFPVFVLFPATILSLALLETARGSLGRRVSFLGDISYSSYMLHFPLQLGLTLLFMQLGWGTGAFGTVAGLAAFFVLLIACSLASYRYLEMPAQAYLRNRRAAG
jgi:peptidoglycan/LPS O-acetylase OafA/YrhL